MRPPGLDYLAGDEDIDVSPTLRANDDDLQDHRRQSSLRPTGVRPVRSGSIGSVESSAVVFTDMRMPVNNGHGKRAAAFSFSSMKRRLSRSSYLTAHSGVSVRSHGSKHSQASRQRSLSFGDSDSENLDRTTHEDVCLPMQRSNSSASGVNIGELDQMLNLSDSPSESGDNIVSDSAKVPEPAPPQASHDGDTKIPEIKVLGISSCDSGSVLQSDSITAKPPPQVKLSDHCCLSEKEERRIPDLEIPDSYDPHLDMARCHSVAVDNGENEAEAHRFSFFATGMDTTIHAPDFGSLVGKGESFASLFNKDQGVWWLDCCDPTGHEVKLLSRAFGIHPLTSEDIQVRESREKIEMFKKYYFVSFRAFENDPKRSNYLEPANFYMIIFTDGILTFHFELLPYSRNVRRRIRQLRDYVTVTPDWICYALIDDIVDSFAPVIHQIEHQVDRIEDTVYKSTSNKDMPQILEQMMATRKLTMSMIRLMSGKADVLRGFAKRCDERWDNMPNSEVALYLGDIQDHIVTMSQNLSAYEKILSRSHSNYMAKLEMDFVHSSNRLTSILSKATLIGTILLPMTLITGLFGMNVHVPGQDVENLDWFFGIMSVIIFVVLILGYSAHMWINRYS